MEINNSHPLIGQKEIRPKTSQNIIQEVDENIFGEFSKLKEAKNKFQEEKTIQNLEQSDLQAIQKEEDDYYKNLENSYFNFMVETYKNEAQNKATSKTDDISKPRFKY